MICNCMKKSVTDSSACCLFATKSLTHILDAVEKAAQGRDMLCQYFVCNQQLL